MRAVQGIQRVWGGASASCCFWKARRRGEAGANRGAWGLGPASFQGLQVIPAPTTHFNSMPYLDVEGTGTMLRFELYYMGIASTFVMLERSLAGAGVLGVCCVSAKDRWEVSNDMVHGIFFTFNAWHRLDLLRLLWQLDTLPASNYTNIPWE